MNYFLKKETLLRKSFLFLFLIFNLTVQGQEYGILVKHTMDPFLGWNGSHGGVHNIKIGAKSASAKNTTTVTKIEFDFFYVEDNPTEINCIGQTAGNYTNPDGSSNDCQASKTIPYNKDTFNQNSFDGCIGSSEIMGIHLPITGANTPCINDVITLSFGWNWQYSYDGISWTNFSLKFQEKRTITFKINELIGYAGKTKIYFRTGYGTKFTNPIKYEIIGCSPALDPTHPPIPKGETCFDKKDGEVIYTFSRPLVTGERFLFTYNPVGSPTAITSAYSDNINMVTIISPLEYKLINITPGTYNFKYQTQFNNNTPSSPVKGDDFIITPKQNLTFKATPEQPKCNSDKGSITVTAQGGTSPYFYILDYATEKINGQDVPKKVPITNPIQGLSEGNHNIKVVDTNGCIEKITP
jgi:hypothetical protein